MALIDGKSAQFGTLAPFGMWNRIAQPNETIWLECGMLKYSSAYFNPQSYVPASYKFDPQYSIYCGALSVEYKFLDTVLGTGYDVRLPSVTKILTTPPTTVFTGESKALGCAVKSDTVTMINPRGEEVTCSYSFVPTFTPPLIPNPTSLGSLMTFVDTSTTGGTSGGYVNESCIKPDHLTEDYTTKGNKQFCDSSIMEKKFCMSSFPASVCSGKLRLYVQCIYGGTEIKYKLSDGALSVGKTLDGEITQAPRVAVIGRGTHILFTYNYHHFLIRTSTFSVNPLVPIGVGHKLKRYLQSSLGSSLSQQQQENIEAYLLSISFPTLSNDSSDGSAAAREVHRHGYPFDFGLNANWSGSQACAVMQTKDDKNYRITTLVDVSITCSSIDAILLEEMDRKCESLIKDYNVLKGVDFYPQGINRHYVARDVKVIEVADPTLENPDNTKILIVGDVEDGEWWYFAKAVPGDTQFDSQVKQKNRVEGGLPYTIECLKALSADFSISVSNAPSSSWMEPLNVDKIFVWDPYYGDYEWKLGCNPRQPDNHCPPGMTAGSFPVYAWYTKTGEKVIANYTLRIKANGDQDGYPPEGMCGPGYDSEMYKIYPQGGYVSGFSVNTVTTTKLSGSNYNRHFAEVNIGAGSWLSGATRSDIWAATCGCGFCDGTEEPTCCGGIRTFFTHWVTTRYGDGVFNNEDGEGSTSHFSFLLIPKDDCQALHIGASQFESETASIRHAVYNKCGNAQRCSKIWWTGTPKVVGPDARGWITCFGLYFAKAFYSAGVYEEDGITVRNPDEFATGNWCIFYPGGTEVGNFKCNFRKWGPDGPEDEVVGLVSPWLAGVVSDETKTKFIIRKEISCYYILPTGIGVETAAGSTEGQSETSSSDAEIKTILSNPYTYLLRSLDLRWPYAGCGAIYNSNSTINKSGHLSQIIGAPPGTYPHPWPFGNGFTHPVGYV